MSAPPVKLDRGGQIGIMGPIFFERIMNKKNAEFIAENFAKKMVQSVPQRFSIFIRKTNEAIVNNFNKLYQKLIFCGKFTKNINETTNVRLTFTNI